MTKPPLVLLHGVTNSALIWDEVVPLMANDYDLIVPTAAGHRGGPSKPAHATIAGLVDDVEKLLDERGIDRAHIAGNSMGGWMAIELARRGRALSVCALSPAGCWTPGSHDETHATEVIRKGRARARMGMPLVPLAMRSARLRQTILGDAAAHADRMTPRQAVEYVRDLVECDAAPDLLGTDEYLAPLADQAVPITLAWSKLDRIFPPQVNGAIAQRLIPHASYRELDDVGHIPMIDDPALCARTIRESIPA